MENTKTEVDDEKIKGNVKTFKKLGKGTLVGFAGDIIHLVFTLGCYGLITRYISKKEYGYLSLALAFVNILSVLSCLGFDKSIPGLIARKLQEKKSSFIQGSIYSSFVLCVILSTLSTITIYLLSDNMGYLLNKPGLSYPLKVLSISIPFIALTTMMKSYLQSFHNVWGKIYNIVLTPLFRVIFVIAIILMHLPFNFILWAHVLSFSMVAFFLYFYTKNSIPQHFQREFSSPIAKELVKYSFPLFLSSILIVVLMWADTIILSYFAPADEVGAYNAGLRLTRLLCLLYMSSGFIFLPIAAELYFKKRNEELKLLYSSVAKWLVALTLPFFIFFFLAPDESMRFFFGAKYGMDNDFLRILAISFFSHILVGQSETTLIAIGRNKTVMFCLSITVCCKIILNLILIPLYGKIGAAISLCIAVSLDNILSVFFLYRFTGIHPFTRDYLKLIGSSLAAITVLTVLMETNSITLNSLELFMFSMLLVPACFFLTKSYSTGDILLMRIVEKKITNNTLLSDKLMNKF